MENLMRTNLIGTIAVVISGCATVFKGYESELIINDAPPDLIVQTEDGITLRTIPQDKITKSNSLDGSTHFQRTIDPSAKIITLRSGKEYFLLLKSGEKESRARLYPKLDAGWLILDLLCGVFPACIDMYLGTWMYYDPIVYTDIPSN